MGETPEVEVWRRLGGSFVVGGADYERLRPPYPAEAVRWCVGEEPVRVADVGAGTGKLTRALREAGHDVVAVEPSAAMRGAMAAALTDVEVVDGTGEGTGLPDDSVDVVTFGQSWHWVERMAGSAELVRVLRPGGAVAMLWNQIDTDVAWVDRLQRTMHDTPLARDRQDAPEPDWTPVGPFGPAERHTVRWEAPRTRRDLADEVTTHSYFLASDADEQRRHLARVRDRVEQEFPGLSEDVTIALPYRTACLRYRLQC